MAFFDKISDAAKKAKDGVAAACGNVAEFSGKTAGEIGEAIASAPDSIARFGDKFSESDFWKKTSDVAAKAGKAVISMALTLFYGIESAPMKDKMLILGALGYFILPVDAIPDFIPVTGYTDDLAALTAIYNTVKGSLGPEATRRADEKLKEWFKEDASESESLPPAK